MRDPKPLRDLTITEVAAYFKIHRNTVEQLIKRGHLHPYKVGRQYRVTPEELLRFRLANTTPQPTSRT